MRYNKALLLFIIMLIVDNSAVWFSVIKSAKLYEEASLFFLDVGQGDASLLVLPGNVQIIIDAGPRNGSALKQTQKILSQGDRYIDVLMVSHPEADHFGGFLDIIGQYDVGVVFGNGIPGKSKMYEEFASAIYDKKIPYIQINTGDTIRYLDYNFSIFNPDRGFFPKNPNDASIVTRFTSNTGFSALFTGDIGMAMEQKIIQQENALASHILKVPHHGSKFSSSNSFMQIVHPDLAVVSVGKNSYGHPTKEALDRIHAVVENIIRTDRDGTVKIVIHDD